MTKSLEVYFFDVLVGYFEQNKHGKNIFRYDESYLAATNSLPISISLPLQAEAFDTHTTHNFFAGMLPEDSTRKIIARNLGVSANNDYSILEKIGGECAGALSIRLNGASEHKPGYKELSKHELAKIINELPTKPLLAGDFEIRISLAGVQEKLAVAIHDNKIYLPLNGAPSTHILKPEIPGLEPNTVINEAYCLKLAHLIGLKVADCTIGQVDDKKYLLVQRYDRLAKFTNQFEIMRFHQEDFCQALDIDPKDKYQNEGGPSIKQCFKLLRNVATQQLESIPGLLDAIIFNFIVGNCDAHGKNFSLLYFEDKINLSPLYDILCTRIYPGISDKMAMKIGGEYVIDKVQSHDLKEMFEDCGLNKSLSLQRLREINDLIINNVDQIDLAAIDYKPIAVYILKRAQAIKNML